MILKLMSSERPIRNDFVFLFKWRKLLSTLKDPKFLFF